MTTNFDKINAPQSSSLGSVTGLIGATRALEHIRLMDFCLFVYSVTRCNTAP